MGRVVVKRDKATALQGFADALDADCYFTFALLFQLFTSRDGSTSFLH